MKKSRLFVLRFLAAVFLTAVIFQAPADAASLRDQMIAEAKKEKRLVVTGSIANDIKEKLVGFRKRYPFISIRDLEMNTKSAVNRVSLEAKAKRLTIDWAGISEDGAEIFVRQGLNAKLEFPHLKDFVPGSQPPHGLYVGGFANPRVQGIYNTDMIKPEDVPKSWEEMGDPKWVGNTMISRSAEEMPARVAWLWSGKDGKWAWERSFELFRKIKAQKPMIGRGFVGGGNRVAAGEVAIFWFAPASIAARLAVVKKAPMGLIAFPKFFAGLRAWSIFKDAPHPASAWLLTDYLTSPEGQFDFTENCAGFTTLNQKAKPGVMGRWVMDRGGSVENTRLIDLSKLEEIYSQEYQEKSEQFFFKLMGLR